MGDYDYRKLDNLLHSRIRLAAISLLAGVDEADFTFIKRSTATTDGNLNSHMGKLEKAGYVSVRKTFVGRKPATYYKLTTQGREALVKYIKQLSTFLTEGSQKKE